ncbi:hypothetical protein, partial [Staphylococcus aureus]|uniref:hypothetical protein n=1 Tax=Staphylococcus aureus TaxID=1280 RepID=UPI00210E7582
ATLLNEITTIKPNEVVINDNISDNLKRQINMVTETLTVMETLSSEIMLATAMAIDFDSPFVSNFVFFGSGISDNA